MSELLRTETLILILIACILLANSNSMLLANAQLTNTSLTITVPYSPPWKTQIIEATLKDENGNPLPNREIDFFYDCDNHTHLLWSAETDSNGVASVAWTWSSGTYNVTAVFSRTSIYASSSSEYIEIIITDYTPYLVGCGLIAVAIIGAVGYGVFRRRSKRTRTINAHTTI